MLARDASIVFPALLLHDDEDFYSELSTATDLFVYHRTENNWLIDGEIVDSAGHRFLIRAIVDVQPVESADPTPFWKRWLGLKNKPDYRVELEVDSLPAEPFMETLHRVIVKEAAQEAYHIFEGGGPDMAESKADLRRCKSIADIIAHNNPPSSRAKM